MPEKALKPKPETAATPPDARRQALEVLLAILVKRQPLDEAWAAQQQGIDRMERRDQSFCRLLVLTTLRNKGFIDKTLDGYLPERTKLPERVQMSLRLGFTQLCFLQTPAHAAISTCLDLLEKEKKHIRGVVNAVLRRISIEVKDVGRAEDHWQENIPGWLQDSWEAAYGMEAMQAIAAASLKEPRMDITVADNSNKWVTALAAAPLPNGSLRLAYGADITQLEGYKEGRWWVQDAAAALPVRLAGDVKGKTVYDLCAAPGGKTAQFAFSGATVIAIDRSKARLMRFKENMLRLGLDINVIQSDAAAFLPEQKADIVLLDAPCSATGTLRRHPDLMHVKAQEDVSRLAAVQLQLLRHAARLVKDNGLLIYATCSLQAEEGPEVIKAFLDENGKDWQRQPVQPSELGENPADFTPLISAEGDLRTWPCHWGAVGGMDGFYAARLKRIGS
jgi:16S rRNA (cytosine967-C5)-methyltransferase